MHYFNADNTEVIFIATYGSWTDIDAGQKMSGELINEVWPDEAKRKQFLKKLSRYYTGEHSDYVYHNVPELAK